MIISHKMFFVDKRLIVLLQIYLLFLLPFLQFLLMKVVIIIINNIIDK